MVDLSFSSLPNGILATRRWTSPPELPNSRTVERRRGTIDNSDEGRCRSNRLQRSATEGPSGVRLRSPLDSHGSP